MEWFAASLVAAYLVGSMPFGYLIARSRGIDIRERGSGNIGATNVYRMVGPRAGLLTFALDFAKGLVAVLGIPAALTALAGAAPAARLGAALEWLPMACGALVMAGHAFPVFLGFRGGKGVATGAGLVVGLAPWAALGAAITWALLFGLSRTVSMASIGAAAAVVLQAWWLYADASPAPWLAVVLTLLALLVILRHRDNIRRLLRRDEYRFSLTKGRQEVP